MKDPHTIIIAPRITQKSAALSYGDPRIKDEADLQRQYTFLVAKDANKIEIKAAFEAIYNAGKKKDDFITVTQVRTVKVLGKKRRVGQRAPGKKPDQKKAIITLAKGQKLEDYGV
ncbi:MAG: 50S ribosomal protein L23 [Fimbriimonadaceae bacterium]|jgi:large subunit ribosomal protein L23|nr:50S ribosomal protein L23 [Fimbriimonadaceae bacterium]